jgi:hypothetical protein
MVLLGMWANMSVKQVRTMARAVGNQEKRALGSERKQYHNQQVLEERRSHAARAPDSPQQ